MKATVIVKFKDDVLDAQGRAVAKRLGASGFSEVKEARIGKYIELELETGDRDNAERRVLQMCEQLLSHPTIEEYEFVGVE